MAANREKFATQVNSETLAGIRSIAQAEGRQLQALVDEALADFIEKRKNSTPSSACAGRLPGEPSEIRRAVQEAGPVTDYLTVAEVIAMHADQIERYGGAAGIRDPGILEAALIRPQTGYYADLIEEAAALWECLAQNHPFIDGNKCTAFAATYTFLAINGTRLTASAEELDAFIASLYASNRFVFEALVPWLRAHTERYLPAILQSCPTAPAAASAPTRASWTRWPASHHSAAASRVRRECVRRAPRGRPDRRHGAPPRE